MLEQQSPLTPPQRPLFEAEGLEMLKTERQQWEETTVQSSKQRMPEREYLMTTSGVPIKRVYTPEDNALLGWKCQRCWIEPGGGQSLRSRHSLAPVTKTRTGASRNWLRSSRKWDCNQARDSRMLK